MFIRKIRKRNGRTKKIYEYLNLVESIRTENGPRQRLLLNLGNIDLHPSQYTAFAKRIEDILTGQKSFVKLDENLERHARAAAREIFKKQSDVLSAKDEACYKNIDITSLEIENPRSVGAEYICHSIWEELGLSEFFNLHGISKKATPLLESLVIGRLIEPGSERHTKDWADNRSAIYELTGYPLRSSLNSYYRGSDKIYSLKDELERHLCRRERDLFSLSEKMFFFDLTNSYIEGESMSNPKANRGYSKDKRSDCKLITLGLVVDETGFSKYSKVFPGNQTEAATLREMIEELDSNLGSILDGETSDKKRTVVIDAGIATEENIDFLKVSNYHYIAVNRGDAPFESDYSQMQVIKEEPSKGIKVEVKRFIHEGEAYIICRSERKKGKERGIRERVEDIFLERLEYYRNGLKLPNRLKSYKKIVEVIGRLKEKYPKAAKLYNVEVIPEMGRSSDDPAIHAVDIIWNKKDDLHKKQLEGEGSYILRTDRLDLSDEEIWEIYVMLTRIEYAFKCLKSSLGLRPAFHQIESRVDAHLFISVLAYHILHIIEHRLRAKGDNRSWSSINDIMKTHIRATISYNTKTENNVIQKQFIRLNSKLEPEHLEIYRKLNLSPIPLPRKRFIKNRSSDHNFP